MTRPVRTSAFSSRISPGINSSQFRRLGWDQTKLSALLRLMRDISLNLNRMSHQNFQLNAHIQGSEAKLASELISAEIKGDQIDVTLELGREPGPMLQTLPFALSHRLAGLMLNRSGFTTSFMTAFSRATPAVRPRISELIEITEESYLSEKGIEFEPGATKDLFYAILRDGGPEIVKWQLAKKLMAPRLIERPLIEHEFEVVFSGLQDQLRETNLEAQVPIWSVVSTLALFSVIAGENNCSDIALKCQTALSGDPGKQLAASEYLIYDEQSNGMLSRLPFMIESQMDKSIDIFQYIFGRLPVIYTLAYLDADSILAEISR